MLARFVRQCFGWEVWSTIERDDPIRVDRVWTPWRMLQDGYLVGQWTGPQRDLFCVTRCNSLDEAVRCLAPRAPTIMLATLASLMIRAQSQRHRGPQRGVLAEVVPIVKRRYARELAIVAEQLRIAPLD